MALGHPVQPLIPAKAGIHKAVMTARSTYYVAVLIDVVSQALWIPAFAGTTNLMSAEWILAFAGMTTEAT